MGAPTGNPRILVGRKGIGKTAVIERLQTLYHEVNVPGLLIRPEDIDTSNFEGKTDIGSLKGEIYKSLIASVSAKLGTSLKGMLTGDQAVLYNQSVKLGYRDPSFTANILYILQTLGKPVADLNGPELVKKLSPEKNSAGLRDVLNSHLSSKGSIAYLFVDDTDQIASPEEPTHRNRIWALLLAIRKLAQECPNLRCIATLRTEVWLRLSKNERGQRDQIDHIRPLILQLRAPELHMAEIIKKRILKAASTIRPFANYEEAFSVFFENVDVRLPTSTERRSWISFLLKNSRERPRDAIQLIGSIIDRAIARNSEKIDDIDVELVMTGYSKDKANDLSVEMGEICSNFLELIRSFKDHRFDWECEELIAFLSKVPSKFGIYIYGVTMHPNSKEDAIKILNLLHESEFLSC